MSESLNYKAIIDYLIAGCAYENLRVNNEHEQASQIEHEAMYPRWNSLSDEEREFCANEHVKLMDSLEEKPRVN